MVIQLSENESFLLKKSDGTTIDVIALFDQVQEIEQVAAKALVDLDNKVECLINS